MTATTLTLPDLLERAGFKLRGKNRADCARCDGHSVATVSYTDEVAFCHRCQWTANLRQLAKQLKQPLTPETTEQILKRARERRFKEWRDTVCWNAIHRLWKLREIAKTATDVLNRYPDCEPAWDALARHAVEEHELQATLDWLQCVKDSPYLEQPSTEHDVYQKFLKWQGQ